MNDVGYKVLKTIEILYGRSFYDLFFTKMKKEDLLKIKNVSLNNEEYEQIILIDKMIENEYYTDSIEEENNFVSRELEDMINNFSKKINNLENINEKSDIYEDFKKIYEEVKNQGFKLNKLRKDKILSREIIPFDEGSKEYNMFEYYRYKAIENIDKLNEQIKNLEQ